MEEYKRNSACLGYEKSPKKRAIVTIWAQKEKLHFFKRCDMLDIRGFRGKP